jgi:putative membrane protein
MAERVLVLNVDIDNDLYRKTKISGPLIGRIENLRAASKLALADPQDSDSNAMFEAVRKYDELKRQRVSVNVATVTGAEKEGYVADTELSRQIDMVIERVKADSCILVTDGSSDARVVPLLKNRLKIDSVDIVRMKQAEAFENTYFTILEKLKEPHYARIVFGIPAVLLLLFALSYYFNFGWQLPVALVGAYLVIKGFGIEDTLLRSFKGLGFSIDRLSFIFYIVSIIFFVIGLVLGSGSYSAAIALHSSPFVAASQGAEGFLLMLPVSLTLFLFGRIIDLESRRLRYRAIALGTYVGYSIVAIALLYLTASWFVGQIYFWQFLVLDGMAVVLGYGLSLFTTLLRIKAIKRSRMKEKKVVNELGAYIGKVTDVDAKRGLIYVKTDYGNVIKYEVDRITSTSERVVIR